MTGDTDRGQAYTLEGVVSAILVASALVVGLQAVDPAPWLDDEPFDTEEYRAQVNDMLAVASDGTTPADGGTDKLTRAVTCLDTSQEFTEDAYDEDSELGPYIDQTIGDRNYKINVTYWNTTTDTVEETVTETNTATDPSSTSISVTRQVPLFANDPITIFDGGECVEQDEPLSNPGFPVDDQYEGDELYAIATVEVVVW